MRGPSKLAIAKYWLTENTGLLGLTIAVLGAAAFATFFVPTGASVPLTGEITGSGLIETDTGSYPLAVGVIVWTVFAPTSDMSPGALAGHYGGATASATAGVGLGANVLVGGLNNSIALQPLSIEGSTGLNVAAGIAGLTLRRARMGHRRLSSAHSSAKLRTFIGARGRQVCSLGKASSARCLGSSHNAHLNRLPRDSFGGPLFSGRDGRAVVKEWRRRGFDLLKAEFRPLDLPSTARVIARWPKGRVRA